MRHAQETASGTALTQAPRPSFETLEHLTVALEVPAWALFQSGGEPSPTSVKRVRDMAALCDMARGLGTDDLEMAVDILYAVSKRRGPQDLQGDKS